MNSHRSILAGGQTLSKNGTVTYSVRKVDFYVISGSFGTNIYYERLTISPECPGIFNAFRVFHPQALDRTLNATVTRMSESLRGTYRGVEGAVRFNN